MFFGLLAGCELAVTLDTYLRSNRETAMIVVKDTSKGVIGLPPVSPGRSACSGSFKSAQWPARCRS